MMKDDSAPVLEAKTQVRRGKIDAATFTATIEKLRSAGKDRDRTKLFSPATRRAVAAATAAPETPATARSALAGRGGDGGHDPVVGDLGGGPTPTLRRNVSSEVLRKLGGRLGLTAGSVRPDQSSGCGGQSGSPARDGTQSYTGRRTRSPRRGIGSPRQDAGAEGGGGGGDGGGGGGDRNSVTWRPWSLSSSTHSRSGARKVTSMPSSPTDRLALKTVTPSPDGMIDEWGQGVTPAPGGVVRCAPMSSSPSRRAEREEARVRSTAVVSQGQLATEQQGRQVGNAHVPMTASDIDNLSSVSNTSTVLTDLSLRLEKIEDMLSRLLDAYKRDGRSGERDGEGGLRERRESRRRQGSQGSDEPGTTVVSQGNEGAEGGVHGPLGQSLHTGAHSLSAQRDNNLSAMALRSTAEQVREARGQLHLLEAEGVFVNATSIIRHRQSQMPTSTAETPVQPTAPSNDRGSKASGPSARRDRFDSGPPRRDEGTGPPEFSSVPQSGEGMEGSPEGERKDDESVGDGERNDVGRGGEDSGVEERNEDEEEVPDTGEEEREAVIVHGRDMRRLSTISESPVQ